MILPPSALDRLTNMMIDDYPMLFEVSNAKHKKKTHCGVLEFVAEEDSELSTPSEQARQKHEEARQQLNKRRHGTGAPQRDADDKPVPSDWLSTIQEWLSPTQPRPPQSHAPAASDATQAQLHDISSEKRLDA